LIIPFGEFLKEKEVIAQFSEIFDHEPEWLVDQFKKYKDDIHPEQLKSKRTENFELIPYKSHPIEIVASTYNTDNAPIWNAKLEDNLPNDNLKICTFCNSDLELIFYKKNGFFVQLDDYPITKSHLLINPISHVFSFALLNKEELDELDTLHRQIREILREKYAAKGFDVIFFEHGSTISEEKKISTTGASIVHAHLQVNLVPKEFDFMMIIKDLIGTNNGLKIIEIKKMNELANRNIVPENVPYLFVENTDGRMWVIVIKDTRSFPPIFLRRLIAEKLGSIELGNWKILSDEMRTTYCTLIEKSKKKLLPMFEKTFPDEEISKQHNGLVLLDNVRRDVLDILYLGNSSKRLFKIKKLLKNLIENLKITIATIEKKIDKKFKVMFAEKRAIKGKFNKGIRL